MVLRRLLPVLLLLVPLSRAQHCAHFSQDELLSRLESHVGECLGTDVSSSALSTLTENFVANDFDRRQPLALVLFSNSSNVLHSLSGAIASALFGATRSPHTVESVDFEALIESPRDSNYDMKQTLRSALATPLSNCPQRNLFVLDNVQALDDAALPVLDVFLDPLNGKRAQFQQFVDGRTSRVFDCTNSIFLFLYKVKSSQSSLTGMGKAKGLSSQWREFLMQQWTRSEGTTEEFTPQAFVGRLTDAVAAFPAEPSDEDQVYNETTKSHRWRQLCELQPTGEDGEAIGVEISVGGFGAAEVLSSVTFLAVPGYLLILTRAKRWNRETTKKQERGSIHRHSSKRKRRKNRK
ncbi:hypothetical protein PHYBOEH_006512 [Phytophthora boehmeriae]|uniref:Uncharacterized protein n=1 Tax=Phytophthora boehmeriae TaxID=109152 RepID=A0A8T1WF80_9STRA|nr:hypothetical protein PHYBOEH_006512 [Phytophthora boehmeriae]